MVVRRRSQRGHRFTESPLLELAFRGGARVQSVWY